jgi:hypothetical protein
MLTDESYCKGRHTHQLRFNRAVVSKAGHDGWLKVCKPIQSRT